MPKRREARAAVGSSQRGGAGACCMHRPAGMRMHPILEVSLFLFLFLFRFLFLFPFLFRFLFLLQPASRRRLAVPQVSVTLPRCP